MKKTYQKPNILVVELRAAKMLAASTDTLGFGSGTKSGGSANSNGYDDDFDDEDSWW